jgi:hypothetical protein
VADACIDTVGSGVTGLEPLPPQADSNAPVQSTIKGGVNRMGYHVGFLQSLYRRQR